MAQSNDGSKELKVCTCRKEYPDGYVADMGDICFCQNTHSNDGDICTDCLRGRHTLISLGTYRKHYQQGDHVD